MQKLPDTSIVARPQVAQAARAASLRQANSANTGGNRRKKNPYHHRAGRCLHNHTIVRRQMVANLAAELETDAKDIYWACAALKVSVRRALNEA